jgi:hypothetical protein
MGPRRKRGTARIEVELLCLEAGREIDVTHSDVYNAVSDVVGKTLKPRKTTMSGQPPESWPPRAASA